MKRIAPVRATSRAGPVKTSPLGMLRWPSEFTQVRPLTLSVRSVPSASMRSSRGAAQALDQRVLEGAQARATRATGSGWSRNIARAHERGEVVQRPCPAGGRAGRRRPQRRAPALLQRRARAPGAARGRRARSAPGRRRRARAGRTGAWMPSTRVEALGLGHREVVEVVEVQVARVLVEAARLAGQLDVEARPRVALEDRALQLEQQRRRERRSSARRPSGRGCTSRQ